MILIIGYGNPLRSDDGVGWAIAEGIAHKGGGITVLTCHALAPELTPAIAEATAVIFVDARLGGKPGRVQSEPVVSGTSTAVLGHTESPATMIGLTEILYQRRVPAYAVSVDAADFRFGTGLSPAVAAAVPAAIETISNLVDTFTIGRGADLRNV